MAERHESARRDRCRLIVLPGSVFACLHGWPAGKLITICGQGISGQGVCGREFPDRQNPGTGATARHSGLRTPPGPSARMRPGRRRVAAAGHMGSGIIKRI